MKHTCLFLGATAGTPVARVALFNRVRLGLPPPTRDFWDAAVEREIRFIVKAAAAGMRKER